MAKEQKTEAAEIKEQPTLGASQSEQVEVSPEDQAKVLLETLNKLNLNSPEKIQSTFEASKQQGWTAELLGAEREAKRQLEQRIAAIEAANSVQAMPGNEYVGESIDLKKVMQEVVRGEIGNFVNEQRQAHTATMREYANLQSDPDYSLVQQTWERHIANPNVQMNIQAGQTTLTNEFNKMKLAFYRGIALNSRDTIQGLINKTSAGATPPHVETSDTGSHPLPEPDERADALRKLRAQGTGTEDDIDAMLNVILPDTDPFFIMPKASK